MKLNEKGNDFDMKKQTNPEINTNVYLLSFLYRTGEVIKRYAISHFSGLFLDRC